MSEPFIELSLNFGGRSFPNAADGVQEFIRLEGSAWLGAAKEVAGSLRDYLSYVANILKDTHGAAWSGASSSRTLKLRSGELVASIIKSVDVQGTTWDALQGRIGSSLPYAAIHEYGGTISGRGKLLTIPLPAALTARGTEIRPSEEWTNTFVAMSRRGNLILFQRRGVEIVPLYVLKSSVTIPARLRMRETLREKVPYFLERAADAVAHEFGKVFA